MECFLNEFYNRNVFIIHRILFIFLSRKNYYEILFPMYIIYELQLQFQRKAKNSFK